MTLWRRFKSFGGIVKTEMDLVCVVMRLKAEQSKGVGNASVAQA
jgi:hypothetical protein